MNYISRTHNYDVLCFPPPKKYMTVLQRVGVLTATWTNCDTDRDAVLVVLESIWKCIKVCTLTGVLQNSHRSVDMELEV